MINKPQALFLAPETPYPTTGGGAIRTASLLEHVAARYLTDLIVFREPGAPDPRAQLPQGLVRRATVLDLAAHGRGFAARALRNAGRLLRNVPPLMDRFSGFEDAVLRATDGFEYDLGVIEHFWCAPYQQQIDAACERTVLDLHNVESVLHGRCARVEPGAIGVAHRAFEGAARRLEQQWLPRFSKVLTASDADASAVRAIAPKANVSVYPNSVRLVPLPPPGHHEAIVFSGNMEYHPNFDAVRFFRSEIWPLLREKHHLLTWRLVGKNPHAVARLVSSDSRIELVGPVPDAVTEIARSRIAVVPLRTGSGTRLKILEAWTAGLPVVSTSLGAEGLPARDMENILLADTPDEFARAVTRLLTCPELCRSLGTAGRLLVEKEFTWESARNMLDF
ncbi:MAG TPA: glycosyltransferase family 4 protein [Verrucomicrobiae bacterium]|nr:glycosyltransferase family 4 protein [Verrucomicrobiae bacterium]